MGLKQIIERLAEIPGVITVLLLGRDGMLLESASKSAGDNPEMIAAYSRDTILAAERMTADLGQGNLIMGIMEFSRGVALIANISRMCKLLVLSQRGTNLADLWNAVGQQFVTLRKSVNF